jgi:hypothetical protein
MSINWQHFAFSPVVLGKAAARLFILTSLVWLQPMQAQQQQTDPYPYGAISFFNGANCPPGWATFSLAAGRLIVPIMQNSGLGGTVGTPLTSGQDVTHTHPFSSSLSMASTDFIGIPGCCNNDVTSDGTKTFSGTSDASSSNVPYIQLLVCMKQENPDNGTVPSGAVTFFGSLYCPSGWSQTITTVGRFLVGLPANGTPGAAFGGDPLGALENRTHTHAFSGNFSTDSSGVGLGSGCCAHGYGQNNTYPYSGTSSPAAANVPYIQLLQCQKQ